MDRILWRKESVEGSLERCWHLEGVGVRLWPDCSSVVRFWRRLTGAGLSSGAPLARKLMLLSIYWFPRSQM